MQAGRTAAGPAPAPASLRQPEQYPPAANPGSRHTAAPQPQRTIRDGNDRPPPPAPKTAPHDTHSNSSSGDG